ncbi:MAG TPA: FmdB family transcriptional regulator [Spirochaetaceae bacterium]|nr:FmdB family transcriptional regulator [Spirochaetaceae bacterium]
MPTYEYECRKCNHSFEQFQSMSEEPLKTCPKCGGKIRRLIGGGTGIIFKGSGFYITDSKKASSSATANSQTKSPKAAKADKFEKPDTCATCPAKTKEESA